MAIFGRKPRHPRDPGMSPYRAGVLALVVIAVFTYFGFTKANPFSNPFELQAVFDTTNNLKPNSPVRIAGVEVGKVTKVEPITNGEGGGRVTMEIKDKALPIHEDAEIKVRPRVFLEGNFFVDISPGSPSSPDVGDGDTIPINQTSAPVQFGDLLAALQRDTRDDLKTFLKEYSKGLEKGGAQGFNQSIPYWKDAYRFSALANDATLGQEPTKDLQRVLHGQARTFRALSEDEQALRGLVTDFNTTAGAFASQDVALEQSIPALRDTLRVANPALESVNSALPSLRAFARDALPGARSSGPTLDAAVPFIHQARLLFRKRELRGLAGVLRRQTPRLVELNETTIPVLAEGRSLSRCTNKVLVPFYFTKIPDPDFPENSNQIFGDQANSGLVALSGESRLSDGNASYFHANAVSPPQPFNSAPSGNQIRPAPTSHPTEALPHRPDVPCETQEPPNLNAPAGKIADFPDVPGASTAKIDPRAQAAALRKAYEGILKTNRLHKRLDERLAREAGR